jgi:hypothetical protein
MNPMNPMNPINKHNLLSIINNSESLNNLNGISLDELHDFFENKYNQYKLIDFLDNNTHMSYLINNLLTTTYERDDMTDIIDYLSDYQDNESLLHKLAYAGEDAGEDAYFTCTGTLISPRIVLTSAHCVLSTGLYYVQYGADQLFDDVDLLEVSATWKNPRYSASQLVNDTGDRS